MWLLTLRLSDSGQSCRREPGCDQIGADPPANVKPLVIKLRDCAEPVRMSARNYAPPQLKFLRDKIRELEELGLMCKNPVSERASPLLILSKTGPD
jgi:hypothetical protein